jgi:hypothetical protein
MKRYLLYAAIGFGALILIFFLLVAAVLAIADNEAERDRFSAKVGHYYGILLIVIFLALLAFGVYKLILKAFFTEGAQQEKQVSNRVTNNEGPIDRYTK